MQARCADCVRMEGGSVKSCHGSFPVCSFLAALDQGSLLGAARATQVSQPTVGRHIAELEAQLGVVLFERTGRGLLPTEMAQRLAESARAMESGANQLARKASAQDTAVKGTVRITASQSVACALLPGVLAHELIGYDLHDNLLKGFAAFGFTVQKESFAFRSDDAMAYWRAVQAGLGVGFVADFLARSDNQVIPLLPMLKIAPLPIWLTVHREIRTSQRIRAVYDFLARAVPKLL
jgi:DNA-binding transcriptional LysR family regulator